MVTRGTFRNKEETYEQKFMLAFARFGSDIGVCFFDCTTLQIYLGQFEDDESLSALRTLSSQIRPVEIIHEREFSTSDIVKMLKNSPQNPTFTPMPPKNCWSFIRTCNNLEKYFGEKEKWPAVLQQLRREEKDLAF
jgi:DNA mismatch repair ATPase MutS